MERNTKYYSNQNPAVELIEINIPYSIHSTPNELCPIDNLNKKKNNIIKYIKIIDKVIDNYNFGLAEYIQDCIKGVLDESNEEYDSMDFDIITEMTYIKLDSMGL